MTFCRTAGHPETRGPHLASCGGDLHISQLLMLPLLRCHPPRYTILPATPGARLLRADDDRPARIVEIVPHAHAANQSDSLGNSGLPSSLNDSGSTPTLRTQWPQVKSPDFHTDIASPAKPATQLHHDHPERRASAAGRTFCAHFGINLKQRSSILHRPTSIL